MCRISLILARLENISESADYGTGLESCSLSQLQDHGTKKGCYHIRHCCQRYVSTSVGVLCTTGGSGKSSSNPVL